MYVAGRSVRTDQERRTGSVPISIASVSDADKIIELRDLLRHAMAVIEELTRDRSRLAHEVGVIDSLAVGHRDRAESLERDLALARAEIATLRDRVARLSRLSNTEPRNWVF